MRWRNIRRAICQPLLIFVLLIIGTALLAACSEQASANAGQSQPVPGGNPARGVQAIQSYGCHSCHTIPGVPGANSKVGPPLNDWAERQYISGRLVNTPENLIFWIMNPQDVEPGTAMPDMDVTEQDARDIAAYLYTLKAGR